MIIRANNKEVQVKSIISDNMKRGGKTYPALRFEFAEEVSAEDVAVLTFGNFEILSDAGTVVATHEGYNTLKSISVMVGKITTAEQQIEELEAAVAAKEAEKTAIAESLAAAEIENANLTTTLETTQAEKDELQSAIDVMVGGAEPEEGGSEE